MRCIFTIYPEKARCYNRKKVKKGDFIINPAYEGVAATREKV
ncbi:hypothetical protein [Chitinophaga rhizophila]|nr:hypothetical protein [Chitinophaga rhizophila]